MTTIFVILVILISVILGLFVLIQNPKGGGLAGNIAGFSNQFMGVKQTTDVLEKGTWIFAAAIGILCITSSIFIGKGAAGSNSIEKISGPTNSGLNTNTQNTAPFNQGQQPAATPVDTGKK